MFVIHNRNAQLAVLFFFRNTDPFRVSAMFFYCYIARAYNDDDDGRTSGGDVSYRVSITSQVTTVFSADSDGRRIYEYKQERRDLSHFARGTKKEARVTREPVNDRASFPDIIQIWYLAANGNVVVHYNIARIIRSRAKKSSTYARRGLSLSLVAS